MFEIGNSLREARTRQGLEFPQVELAVKIRGKYLRALEAEQFETLPAQTYVKGFLRAYADYLGLDGQLYVDEYNSRYVLDSSEEFFRPRRSPQRAQQQRRLESRVLVLALVGIAVLTALVFAAWRYGGGQASRVLPPTTSHRPASRAGEARVVILALRGASMVEVHRDSSLGAPLFTGTLQSGEQPEVFTARRLWLRLTVPSVLRVTVNGVRVPLPAHGPLVAIATKSGLSKPS